MEFAVILLWSAFTFTGINSDLANKECKKLNDNGPVCTKIANNFFNKPNH